MCADAEVRITFMRRLGLVGLVIALGIGIALPSAASVIEKISVARLQEDAEVIVIARVLSSRSVTRGGTIQTETQLAIERSWRGPEKGTLVVRTAGGSANGLTLLARGEASFPVGQKVLVFLYRSGSAYHPVGMFQGVWLVGAPERGVRSIDKTPPTQDISLDRMDRVKDMLVWPSNSNGAHLVALEKGPYAVDGGPRLISELLGNVTGGGR
jgi:hypothetical protein